MMYSAERSPPKLALVEAETTRSIVAFLATAPDHSTSIIASHSSPLFAHGSTPGFAPLTVTTGGFDGRPKRVRKSFTSETLMLLSLTIAIFTPDPVMPAFQT